jgi:hypothetical protein
MIEMTPCPTCGQGWNRDMEAAPINRPVLVWDGMEVDYATFAKPVSIEEWWECVRIDDEPDEPEDVDGYQAYLADEPEGWVSYDPATGDETYMTPVAWMPLPTPPETNEGEAT